MEIIDKTENTQSYDSYKGYYVACNNKLATDNYKYHTSITHGFNSARASRAS